MQTALSRFQAAMQHSILGNLGDRRLVFLKRRARDCTNENSRSQLAFRSKDEADATIGIFRPELEFSCGQAGSWKVLGLPVIFSF